MCEHHSKNQNKIYKSSALNNSHSSIKATTAANILSNILFNLKNPNNIRTKNSNLKEKLKLKKRTNERMNDL